MADIFNDYQSGTVSVANGETAVTGVGSAWSLAAIRPGDLFMRAGLVVPIASVESNTGLTLAEPWPGTSLEDSAYRIRYQPDGSRYTAAARALVESVEDYYPAMQILAEGGSDGQIMGNAGGSPSWVDNVGYAEGTWVPYIMFDPGANNDETYSTQDGKYIRIGDLVFASFRIQLTSKGTDAGNALVMGKPFSALAFSGTVQIGFYSNMALTNPGLFGFISNSADGVALRYPTTAAEASLTNAHFTNTSMIIGTMIYRTGD